MHGSCMAVHQDFEENGSMDKTCSSNWPRHHRRINPTHCAHHAEYLAMRYVPPLLQCICSA